MRVNDNESPPNDDAYTVVYCECVLHNRAGLIDCRGRDGGGRGDKEGRNCCKHVREGLRVIGVCVHVCVCVCASMYM